MTLKVSLGYPAIQKPSTKRCWLTPVDPKCWALEDTHLAPFARCWVHQLRIGHDPGRCHCRSARHMSLGQKAQTFEEQKLRTTKETVGFYHQTFLGQPKDSHNKKHKSSPTKKKNRQQWRILAREQFGFSITESNFISKPDRFHWQILLRVWMTMN